MREKIKTMVGAAKVMQHEKQITLENKERLKELKKDSGIKNTPKLGS